MFVLILALFLSATSRAQLSAPIAPVATATSSMPVIAQTGSNSSICPKLQLPLGCTCTEGLIKPLVSCLCSEVFKLKNQVHKIWVSYDQHGQCVLNYFPGCAPKLLTTTEVDLCKKFKRTKNQLPADSKPVLTCDQVPNFCPTDFRQRCHETPDALDFNCNGTEILNFSLRVLSN